MAGGRQQKHNKQRCWNLHCITEASVERYLNRIFTADVDECFMPNGAGRTKRGPEGRAHLNLLREPPYM